MSSPPPPPPCVLLSLPLPPLDASCVRARAAVLSGGSSESSASDEAELADLVRAWTFAQPVPCCTCRTAHWRTRLARETNQKQMRVLNALSTVLVRAQDDEERRRARRSQQPAAEETNSESKSASAQTPGRESLFSLLATLLRSYVRDLDWSPSVSREEGLWSLPGVFGHVPVPPLSSSMATHRSAIRDALAHLDSLTINGLGLTAPLKQARHFTRDGRLVTGVNDDLFSEVLALLRGSAIGSATYAHASPAPIDVVDGSTSNGNGTAAEAVAILAPSVLPSPLLVEDEASSWLRFADEAEDVPMLSRTTSSRRSRRDRRRAAASEDADVVESKRRRAAAASDTHADEEEDVVMLSQAPQAAAEAELRVADALRDVMHVQPNLPSSGSTSDASSRRSSHESTSSAAAAASASAWLEQWEAEVTAQSADHMTFPLFDDSDADDEGLRSFSQLAAESVAEEERHRAAEMASVRNAEPQETEGGSAVPMEIDAKDGSVAAPASTGTVPAPSPPLPSPPPAAASASPSPAPASSSTSPPAAVGSSAFLAQLASVRKALVSKLSIGAVYPLIELTVQALLTARASSKTAGTTTAPSLAPSQILAKLRVNPRLTSVSASLRLLFDHATQWRGLASVSEFESACVAMRFADLTLPALFVFLLAYLDDTVSGSRARAVLAQGMVERLKTIKDEPATRSTLPRLLSFVLVSHESSLVSGVLPPWLADFASWPESGTSPALALLQTLLTAGGLGASAAGARLSNDAALGVLQAVLLAVLRRHAREPNGSPFTPSAHLLPLLANRALVDTHIALPPPTEENVHVLLEASEKGSRAWTALVDVHESHESDSTSTTTTHAPISTAAGDVTALLLCTMSLASSTHANSLSSDAALLRLLIAYVTSYARPHFSRCRRASLASLCWRIANNIGESANTARNIIEDERTA